MRCAHYTGTTHTKTAHTRQNFINAQLETLISWGPSCPVYVASVGWFFLMFRDAAYKTVLLMGFTSVVSRDDFTVYTVKFAKCYAKKRRKFEGICKFGSSNQIVHPAGQFYLRTLRVSLEAMGSTLRRSLRPMASLIFHTSAAPIISAIPYH